MDSKEETKEIACKNDAFQFRMGLNDNKAGMEGLDKEKINKIIMDATKGSRFYDNELKKDQQVNQRIEKMMQQKAQLTSQQVKKAQIQVDRLALELERGRDLSRMIVHIDMDAFYAAVEMRDNPELKDKPMAVGSMSMLSTSNYLARRFGVRAAMPGFIAKKLCPSLTIVPPNFDKYRAVSKEVREILACYDPNYLPLSLDEAYLDITDHLEERLGWPEDKRTYIIETSSNEKGAASAGTKESLASGETGGHEEEQCTSPVLFEDSPSFLVDHSIADPGQGNNEESGKPLLDKVVVFGTSAEDAVNEMRFRIEQKTTLTASAGIAPNMMLAKVCSDKNKPNGQYRIPHERRAVMDFIKDLPIRKVPGIGKVTEKMLQALGITTCTDLYQQRALLSLLFSETSWHNFLHISLGIGSTHIERDGERKSMSTERTFSEMSAAEEQYELCHELCRDLAQDLSKEGLKAKTVTIKLKNVKFEVRTRASTVSSAISTEEEIFSVAKEILKTEIDLASPEPLRLRLMGVRVSGFLNEEEKRHHQKSIISFLCSGKPANTTPSERPEKDNPVIPASGRPRESFFNQKRAARQLKTQEISTCGSELTGIDQDGNLTLSQGKKEMSLLENLRLNPDLTCPICFLNQRDWDLDGFNKHIDRCLSGSPLSRTFGISNKAEDEPLLKNKSDDNVNHAQDPENVDVCTKNLINKMVDVSLFKAVEDCVINNDENTTGNIHLLETIKADHNHCTLSEADEINSHGCMEDSQYILLGRQVELRQFADHKEAKPSSSVLMEGPTFICPVCNVKQDTTDLAAFNRHVDVCLNKGIIEELTEETSGLKKSHFLPNSQHTGSMGRGNHCTNTKLRSKRPGTMNQNPVAKKSKPNHSTNTIDRFFK
ncbi:DNA polymerase kappa [Rhinophrynus dorsalis]